jgi:lysophospholipase L1-like esterase
VRDSVYVKVRKRVAYELYARKFARHPTRPGDIVFLGDSITAQGDWATWFPGRPVQVRGIGGDSSAGVLKRLESVLDGPAKLFLMVGTNDVWLGATTESIVDTVGRIVNTVRGRTPTTELYVQSVTPRTAALAPAIRAVNARLRDVAVGAGATYVELFDLMCDKDGGLRPGFSDDELHLQSPAYDVWCEAIRPFVEG